MFYAPGDNNSWYYVDLAPVPKALTPAQRAAGELYEVEKILPDGTFRRLSAKPLTRAAAQQQAAHDYHRGRATPER